MENKPQASVSNPPPKPWEQAGQSSGMFKPPSPGSTSDVVEASGTANPGEVVSTVGRTTPVIGNTLARPVPARPWEQQPQTTYGGYGSSSLYNTGYGAGGMYGSTGGYGGSYGGGLYGNNMYRGGYGGLAGGGMYGGGMYNSGLGGSYGGYGMGGMGGMGGPYGEQDPNNPFGASPGGPPGFWISLMRVLSGVVGFFGRVAMLIDQNTQALHMFMNALLQLLDRTGLLYGELARFVLRLLGIRTKPKKVQPPGGPQQGLPGHPNGPMGNQTNYIEGPKAAPNGSWDGLWSG